MKLAEKAHTIINMKWKFLFAVILNVEIIGVITCNWPFHPFPPPPMTHIPRPSMMHEHYMKISHMTPHGPNMPRNMPHPAHSHHIAMSEPQEMIFPFGNPLEVEPEPFNEMPGINTMSSRIMNGHQNLYAHHREEPFKPAEHMNYRKVKNMETGLGSVKRYHNKGLSYDTFDGRTYFDDRKKDVHYYENNHEEKFPEPKKKDVVLEEGSSHGRNDMKSASFGHQSINPTTENINKLPIEITTYTMESPYDGLVTQVTEMLYDIPPEPPVNREPTSSPPIIHPFLPPSTSASMIPPTEDPRHASSQSHQSNQEQAGSNMNMNERSGFPAPFGSSIRNDITRRPQTTWSEPQQTIPTPPQTIDSRLSTSSSLERGLRRFRNRKFTTFRPTQTTRRSSLKENKPNLSSAAIAGIVIGSLVSIVLLAGAALFVLFRSRFRRVNDQLEPIPAMAIPIPPPMPVSNNGHQHQHQRSHDQNQGQMPRVYRWQGRRARRENGINGGPNNL